MTKPMTIKEQIIKRMEDGFCVCEGSVNEFTYSQSGGRRLREIMEDNGKKYHFFWVEPKIKGRMPFKVFFKKSGKSVFRLRCDIKGWRCVHYIDEGIMVETKPYKNVTQAKKAIKRAR